MGIRESATASIKSAPADVFRAVTDIKRLPEWNKGIVEVVELPDQLQEGSLWKVRVRAMGQSWVLWSTRKLIIVKTSTIGCRSSVRRHVGHRTVSHP